MRPRYHALLALAAGLMLATTAFANRSSVTFTPGESTELTNVAVGKPFLPNAPCALGETRAFGGFVDGYLFPPDDRYYTSLNPSQCSGCTASGMILINAHIVLGFPATCDIPVEVSIVPSLAGPCPVPNVNQTICGPVPYTLHGDAGFGYNFSMPLPDGCCITTRAFLLVRFVNDGNCAPRPYLGAVGAPCNICSSYNLNPTYGFVDICTDPFWPSSAGAGNPMMYVDADCCTITHDHPGTWGRVKTLYR